MNCILITGAAGLIGCAAIDRLTEAHRVYGLVRTHPYPPLPNEIELVVHDLRVPDSIDLPETPNTVIHLAQSPRYRDFPRGALDVHEVNVASTQRLLDWACRSGVERFIYASSGGVYGHGAKPFAENTPVAMDARLGHYLASKRCGELLVTAYSNQMIVIVLRFFFVYGPGQRRTMLIPRLLDSVRRERPIILQGEDGFRLNPIYVDDAADALAYAVRLQRSETINIAGPQILTLREVGTLIGRAMGRAPRFDLEAKAIPKHLVGGLDKMARLLGAPKTDFTTGIRQVIEAEPQRSGCAD